MAFCNIIRRTASRVAPLAFRAVESRRGFHSSLFPKNNSSSSLNQKPWRAGSGFLSTNRFSAISQKTKSDESLLRVIESEIKCAEESDDHNRVEEVPDEFPFQIQDNPGEQTISLIRQYNGETIKIEVHMPDLDTGDDNDGDDDDADDEKGGQSSIPLVVSISKIDGPTLEFNCTAYADEVAIDSLSVREREASEDQIAYEGPDFSDLDENLQKAFHKYLTIRGIKPSTTNFLHEYMINKDSKEYLNWLKNLKKFIEK